MFADYRVPQILHHLGIIEYSPELMRMLEDGEILASGSPEEISLRVSSIVAVERVAVAILRLRSEEKQRRYGDGMNPNGAGIDIDVSSVLIDFYLWDLAKRVESGEEEIEGCDSTSLAPIHRTRSIWY